jgi:hypothetical protein
MHWRKSVRNSTMSVSILTVFSALVACAHFPQSMAEFEWTDHWGDRGEGVLARDYQMCSELVEQRRGLLQGCMETKGWQR